MPRLIARGYSIVAFTRDLRQPAIDGVKWRRLERPGSNLQNSSQNEDDNLPLWICVAPIWVLPEYFPLLESHAVKRIVALSSTSRFTKVNSTDPQEQKTAQRLKAAEEGLQVWADQHNVEWIILRPTMIYGLGRDKNVTEIARMIRRWGFFPLLGSGNGLRQPVHAEDVAEACLDAVAMSQLRDCTFNLSGGESLPYREMISRIFVALNRRPRLLHIPRWGFRTVLLVLRLIPRFSNWNIAMVDRMEQDIVFDHAEAMRDLGFQPRDFVLENKDLPH